MASVLAVREPSPPTVANPALVPVATKESSITAAIARIASRRQAA